MGEIASVKLKGIKLAKPYSIKTSTSEITIPKFLYG